MKAESEWQIAAGLDRDADLAAAGLGHLVLGDAELAAGLGDLG